MLSDSRRLISILYNLSYTGTEEVHITRSDDSREFLSAYKDFKTSPTARGWFGFF